MPRTRNGARAVDDDGEARSTAGTAPDEVITRWRDDLFEQVRQRPARSLLLAVGTGYLAGGGLGTILTARLLSLGARIALRLAIIPMFAGEIERALFDGGGAAHSEAKASITKRLAHEKEMDS